MIKYPILNVPNTSVILLGINADKSQAKKFEKML